MAYVTGLFVVDASASALNNAGDTGARTDNTSAVKTIRTPQGLYPYVSAQAVRYWLRESIAKKGVPWLASPTYKESANLAYTAADPIEWWDDDLFGYMRAPDAGSKDERKKDPTFQRLTPLEEVKNRSGKLTEVTITRVSPLRIGTMVSIAPVSIINDFGSMARHEGDPVLHGHQFYRAHLGCLFSLDLTCAGTFFDADKVGIKNLDSIRRKKAEEAGLSKVEVRGLTAFRLPIEQRQERVATLLVALGELDGGAKLSPLY
jgi:CRISPR-associated protein Cst2